VSEESAFEQDSDDFFSELPLNLPSGIPPLKVNADFGKEETKKGEINVKGDGEIGKGEENKTEEVTKKKKNNIKILASMPKNAAE